jgi:hypothetical protein
MSRELAQTPLTIDPASTRGSVCWRGVHWRCYVHRGGVHRRVKAAGIYSPQPRHPYRQQATPSTGFASSMAERMATPWPAINAAAGVMPTAATVATATTTSVEVIFRISALPLRTADSPVDPRVIRASPLDPSELFCSCSTRMSVDGDSYSRSARRKTNASSASDRNQERRGLCQS